MCLRCVRAPPQLNSHRLSLHAPRGCMAQARAERARMALVEERMARLARAEETRQRAQSAKVGLQAMQWLH